jgi:hypothetical protein
MQIGLRRCQEAAEAGMRPSGEPMAASPSRVEPKPVASAPEITEREIKKACVDLITGERPEGIRHGPYRRRFEF